MSQQTGKRKPVKSESRVHCRQSYEWTDKNEGMKCQCTLYKRFIYNWFFLNLQDLEYFKTLKIDQNDGDVHLLNMENV